MSFPLAGNALINSVAFGTYGNVLRQCSDPNSLQSHFFAGACGGFAQSFLTSPLELARTRLQLQGQGEGWSNVLRNQTYAGPLDCVKKIVVKEGFRHGLFKGLTITIVRDIPSFAIYFSAYELVCRFMHVDDEARVSFITRLENHRKLDKINILHISVKHLEIVDVWCIGGSNFLAVALSD
jgi:solute carrier family 25 carnitine/acylcarnitine transporter 20/29